MESPSTPSFEGLLRLLFHSTSILRKIFKERFQLEIGSNWKNDVASAEILSSVIGTGIKFSKADSEKLRSDIERWDVSLLAKILLYSNWTKSKKKVKRQNARILSLVDIRNKVMHSPSFSNDIMEIEHLWNEISASLVYLGESTQVIEEIKNMRSDKQIKYSVEMITRAKNLLDSGKAALSKKKYKEALQLFTDGLHLEISDNDLATFYMYRAACNLELGEEEEVYLHDALKDAKQVIKKSPDWYKGYLYKGKALNALHQYEKAIKAFDSGLALDTKNKELLSGKSTSKMELEKRVTTSYRNASDGTAAPQVHRLKEMYGEGFDLKKFAEKMDSLLDEGDPDGDAENFIGMQYLFGEGRRRNGVEAFKHFNYSASKGNPLGLFHLGYMSEQGVDGIAMNLEFAKSCYEKAIAKPIHTPGVTEALHALGLFYLKGIAVAKDVYKGITYIESAANEGLPVALNSLGIIHLEGMGVESDPVKARGYFEAAAAKGNNLAMANLGQLYLDGKGVPLDLYKARYYFQKAADNGLGAAEDYLNKLERMEQELGTLDVNSGKIQKVKDENPKDYKEKVLEKFNPKELEQYKDSPFIQRIIQAKEHCSLFEKYFESFRWSPKPEIGKLMIREFAETYRRNDIVFKLNPEMVSLVLNFAKEVLKEDDNNLDAHICFIFLTARQGGEREFLVKRIRGILKKFPKDILLLDFLSALVQQNFQDECEILCNKILMLDPKRIEAMYKLAIISFMNQNYTRALQYFKGILNTEDKSHFLFPDGYYGNSLCLILQQDLVNATVHYQLGLNAEKYMISAFLPYVSQVKDQARRSLVSLGLPVDELLSEDPSLRRNSNSNEQLQSESNSKLRLEQLTNYRRREMIKEIRDMIIKVNVVKTTNKIFPISAEPSIQHSASSSNRDLKPIYFEEMDLYKENVYKGRILRGKIVEVPLLMSAIHLLVEDEKGNLERVSLHSHSFQNADLHHLLERLTGKRIDIIDPYLRISSTGVPLIRVDDPRFVVITDSPHKYFCAYCCIESDDMKSCAKCKVAHYCSRDCQEKDWKGGHKALCEVLKALQK